MREGVANYVAKAEEELRQRRLAWQEAKQWKFDTVAVHGLYTVAEAIERNQGAIIEPVYLATSQAYRDSDELEAALAYLIPTWCYARIANPSVYYLEWTLALLEGYGCDFETACCATSSGMAAIVSAIEPFLVRLPGRELEPVNFVASAHVYGGTFQQFAVRQREKGVEVRWVQHPERLEEWAAQIDQHTRFLYGELPSNPTLAFFDIAAVAELAHSHGIPLIVDSTVATPALLRPLQHGADIVVHSATKSLTASGFGIAGAVIARKPIVTNIPNDPMREDFASYIKFLPNRDNGPNLSPLQAILTASDVRTLRVRMDMLSENARLVAEFLQDHPKVERVSYPGLPSYPLHALARRYMWLVDAEYDHRYREKVNRYGHLLSFCVKGGHEAARRVLDGLRRIFRATDLGRIKSVATIPAISTHQQQGEEGRKLASIPDNLIRLSVGAEHPDDLIADLDQALARA
ncbi:MAG: PLP-dependent transferase [Thermoanaerobaculum sp.]|nr:PLP-dependent transferase [Thermoanaerobaculum sp.]MDW7967604.1 PLP-dependent transferase [Thermoanaerobaculum sp.]